MHPHQPDPDSDLDLGSEQAAPDELLAGTPRHGYQGDRGREATPPAFPGGLTIAISREAGSRGGTIARRVGRKLGWQVYDQDLLEYMAQEMTLGRTPLEEQEETALAGAAEWVEDRLQQLLREQTLSQHPSVINLARVILTLAARGSVVLIGRGAGFLLPPATTLHVRILAPLQDRISYFSQWHRLTVEEASEKVQQLDQRRADYIVTHFHRQPNDIHQYDMLLSSSLLGEDICAELVAQAAPAKQEAARPEAG